MKIATWNVNGIRAIFKKKTLDIFDMDFDIIGLQETKASASDLSKAIKSHKGYCSYFASAIKKGYSGVGLYVKKTPIKVELLSDERFDSEGRGLVAYYDDVIVVNCYFPNSQQEAKRLSYKLEFLSFIEQKCLDLLKINPNVILMGDFNIAPHPIDLTYPKANEHSPGYLKEERDWIMQFAYLHQSKFVDIYRYLYRDRVQYTWFDYRSSSREKNIGWRLDYFCVNKDIMGTIKNVTILSDVQGSDHVPVVLEY